MKYRYTRHTGDLFDDIDLEIGPRELCRVALHQHLDGYLPHEFERLTNAAGPTNGRIVLRDGDEVQRVVGRAAGGEQAHHAVDDRLLVDDVPDRISPVAIEPPRLGDRRDRAVCRRRAPVHQLPDDRAADANS